MKDKEFKIKFDGGAYIFDKAKELIKQL